MRKRQIKQMISNLNDCRHQIFLKFCYFILFCLLLSCGSDAAKKDLDKPLNNIENKVVTPNKTSTKTILCFGDSLTAGYGLDDINDAYPALLQTMIDSLGLDYTVINSGLSGETTAGGRSRIQWVLNQKIDVFILELGANDGLRGVPLTETRENLQAIIDEVRKKNPKTKIILAGMQLPPNMGPDYISQFRTIFPDLAKKNNVELIPFILKNVGGIEALPPAAGIHPTEKGQTINASTVWEVLEPLIQ